MNDRQPNIQGIGSWKTRRRFVYGNIAFSMAVIVYSLYKDMKGTVPEHAIDMAFINLFSTIGAYVFGAAWQDISTVRSHNDVRSSYVTSGYQEPYEPSRVDNPD